MNSIYTNERILVRDVLDKKREAVHFFIESYKRLIEHIIWRMVRRRTEREDLVQDIFIKIFASLDGFQFKSKLSSWIGKIAYNTCLNHIQKKKASLAADVMPEEMDYDSFFVSDGSMPDTECESQEYKGILFREIARLNETYRTIITLYHVDNLSYKEIGDIMGLPGGTVKSYLFRARKKLFNTLTSEYMGEIQCQ